jgi:hypothetical protein
MSSLELKFGVASAWPGSPSPKAAAGLLDALE